MVLTEKEKKCLDYWYDLTYNVSHTDRSFYEHCLNVFYILKEHKCNDTICIAGLFHSAYGTEFFRHCTLTDRQELIDRIGIEAEELVHLFCTIPQRIESITYSRNIPDKHLLSLKWIEYANLTEQIPRIHNEHAKDLNQRFADMIYEQLQKQ